MSNLIMEITGLSKEKIKKILKTGVSGFSIARALISGKLTFNIANF